MNSGISPNLIRSCGWASWSSSSSRRLRVDGRLALGFFSGLESDGAFADAALDYLLQSNKGSANDEEDVGGVNGCELLVRMLAATLRRHIGNRAFQNLEQRLLHAFTGNIAGDGRILILAADLVDLIDIDDAGLSTRNVSVGGLQAA